MLEGAGYLIGCVLLFMALTNKISNISVAIAALALSAAPPPLPGPSSGNPYPWLGPVSIVLVQKSAKIECPWKNQRNSATTFRTWAFDLTNHGSTRRRVGFFENKSICLITCLPTLIPSYHFLSNVARSSEVFHFKKL